MINSNIRIIIIVLITFYVNSSYTQSFTDLDKKYSYKGIKFETKKESIQKYIFDCGVSSGLETCLLSGVYFSSFLGVSVNSTWVQFYKNQVFNFNLQFNEKENVDLLIPRLLEAFGKPTKHSNDEDISMFWQGSNICLLFVLYIELESISASISISSIKLYEKLNNEALKDY